MALYANNTKITSAHANNTSAVRVFANGTLVHREGLDILNNVQFTGSQYVDIGFTPNANSVISMNAYFTSNGYSGYDLAEHQGTVAIGKNGTDFCLYNDSNNGISMALDSAWHNYYFGNGFQMCDGVTKGTNVYSVTGTPMNFLIGALNTAYSGITNYISMYLSRFIVTENGTRKYDLYPARRTSDNVVGLYNVVTDVFYTPNGTLIGN